MTRVESGRLGGKASWQVAVSKALTKYPGDLDLAARWLTGHMKNHGFTYHRGVTRDYMARWQVRLAV